MSSDGKFVWYELMTSDTAAAEGFYRSVLGWRARDAGMPGFSYTLFTVGERPVSGMFSITPEICAEGGRPGWFGYVAVSDVDAYADRFAKSGGKIHKAPEDIPGIGRFAVVADPQGAVLALFRGTGPEMDQPPPCTPGYASWHELMAGDREAAIAFYAGMFGWKKLEAMDAGPMGVYQTFGLDEAFGGMMTKPAACPMPFWLYYFAVDGIEPAIARVRAAGGQIMNGPMAVPNDMWIAQCLDPQGAMFALLGPKG